MHSETQQEQQGQRETNSDFVARMRVSVSTGVAKHWTLGVSKVAQNAVLRTNVSSKHFRLHVHDMGEVVVGSKKDVSSARADTQQSMPEKRRMFRIASCSMSTAVCGA